MTVSLPLLYPAAAPDCPGARLGVLEPLIGASKSSCAFETLRLDAKSHAPGGWGEAYGFGMVRRGVLLRQRLDHKGNAMTIDAAGPGCAFPIDRQPDTNPRTVGEYAATDVVLCLCVRDRMEAALDSSHQVGRDLIGLHEATLGRVERIAQARAAGTALEKVASLLGTLVDELSPLRHTDVLPVALQQRDMAKLIGVRHETFCRVVKTLEQDGVIGREDGALQILDRTTLDAV